MQEWEYLVLYEDGPVGKATLAEMPRLGKLVYQPWDKSLDAEQILSSAEEEGWSLVGVHKSHQRVVVLLFRRPLSNE
jgi:hypothetical protein